MSSSASAGPDGNRSNTLVYFFGALGGLLFGYDTGVISGAILYIQDDLGTTSFMNGLIVSGLLIGAMIGAGTAGPLSDRLGRRNIILIAAVIFSVGAIGAALSPNVATLVFFRVVLGVAVGGAALIVPLYLSEVAPTEIRGAVASLNQLMIVSGILAAFIVNYALSEAEAWRWMIGLAAFPSAILFVGMFFMPETPRWLVSKDRDEEARRVLLRTRSEGNADQDSGTSGAWRARRRAVSGSSGLPGSGPRSWSPSG